MCIKITIHRANREELNQLLEEYRETMNDYIETTLRSIKIVSNAQKSVSTRTIESPSIPVIEFFRVLMKISKIKTYWNEMVEADEAGDENFSEAKTEMNDVIRVAKDFLEGLGSNGTNISKMDINKLQTNLFGENKLMEDLLRKVDTNEHLSESEERLLSYYIQNQYFDSGKQEIIDSIIWSVENDSEELIKRLNDHVLQTESSLYEEILMTEMYLFTKDEDYKYNNLSKEEKALLIAYLETLYNYRGAIDEMKGVNSWLKDLDPDEPLLARVDQFNYSRPGEPQAFYIETNIIISKYKSDNGYGREDFFKNDKDSIGHLQYHSKISHYESGDDLQRENNLKDRQEYANHTSDFIGSQLLSLSLNVLLKGNPVGSGIEAIADYANDKSEKEHKMTQGDAELAARDFGLEVQILERLTRDSKHESYEIKFLPTEETYTILNRWKEVVDSGSDIPYPKEEISEENWFLISDFFHRNQTEMKESYVEEFNYIFDK